MLRFLDLTVRLAAVGNAPVEALKALVGESDPEVLAAIGERLNQNGGSFC